MPLWHSPVARFSAQLGMGHPKRHADHFTRWKPLRTWPHSCELLPCAWIRGDDLPARLKSMRSSGRGGPTRRISRPSSRHSVAKPSESPPRRWHSGSIPRDRLNGYLMSHLIDPDLLRARLMAATERGPFRPFGFDDSVRLRTDGTLRRPPPQDVHLGAGAADTGTRLLLLRRLPRRHLSARPGVGLARHVAVARRAADGGAGGVRLQLRRGQRPVVGTGRGARRDQAGRARRRSLGT